jgi:hypothetical protein
VTVPNVNWPTDANALVSWGTSSASGPDRPIDASCMRGKDEDTTTSASGSGNGSGRRISGSATLNTVTLAPMPIASVATMRSAPAGERRCRRSTRRNAAGLKGDIM